MGVMDRLAILLGVFLLCGLATAGWWGDVDSDGDGLTDEVDDDDDNDGLLDTEDEDDDGDGILDDDEDLDGDGLTNAEDDDDDGDGVLDGDEDDFLSMIDDGDGLENDEDGAMMETVFLMKMTSFKKSFKNYVKVRSCYCNVQQILLNVDRFFPVSTTNYWKIIVWRISLYRLQSLF